MTFRSHTAGSGLIDFAANIYFILKQPKVIILEFLQGTAKVLQMNKWLNVTM